MVHGICVSAIWDDDHKVLGFFRYAPASGVMLDYCMSVTADHFRNRRYTIVYSYCQQESHLFQALLVV
ncbi:hypothetical protein BDV28DRAFT_133529 [Aspergillus coremiiformis]|uniref:Uncharacterized protein n=1 Tax=Aspergillus coremiiformis TaxID=138285 RepID=A0A5N6Z6G9_9EURO|nr:hypothetical protein BDV28DRAFT_133529 [Aspergillus coremiiformis]